MKRADWISIALVILVIGILAKILSRKDLDEKHLRNLSPEVTNKFRKFLNDIRALGYTPFIRDSIRTYRQQQAYYKEDSRNARPGHSMHESGLAIDMDLHHGKKVLSKHTARVAWINTGVPELAKKYGIRWGGNFKGYPDNNHFDFIR